MNCAKCGALLPGNQPFCTSCGARQDNASQATAAHQSCASCGAEMQPGLQFCTRCGAAVKPSQPDQPSHLPQAAPQWTAVPAPANASAQGFSGYAPPPPIIPGVGFQSATPVQPMKRPGNLLFKLAIAVVLVCVVGGVVVAGGIAYLGYVAKKRVTAMKQAYEKDDFGGVLAAAKGREGASGSTAGAPGADSKGGDKGLLGGLIAAASGGDEKPQPLPDWKPAPATLVSSPPVRVPLCASLQIDDVGTDRTLGDFESVYKIDSMNKQSLHIKAAQQFPAGQGFAKFFSSQKDQTSKLNKIDCGRTVYLKDVANSAETDSYFCRQNRDERHPGTTAMLFSKKTYNALKTTGQADFTFHDDPLHATFKSFKTAMTTADNDKAAQDAAASDLLKKMMNFAPGVGSGADPMDTPPIPCTLHTAGPDVAFPVVVNDQPTELPAMKVTCKPEGSDHEAVIFVLDDPDNPLIVASGSSKSGSVQVTRIRWDQKKQGENALAQELEKDGRAKVYDLYFDFRSDVLRPESGKVLTEIAQIMRQHHDWTLGVEGNTDNIGGDQYNLDLSQRRAAAVKQALVKQYGIAANRLTTTGFGASHPIETNDTIEGRARNRRVELVRK